MVPYVSIHRWHHIWTAVWGGCEGASQNSDPSSVATSVTNPVRNILSIFAWCGAAPLTICIITSWRKPPKAKQFCFQSPVLLMESWWHSLLRSKTLSSSGSLEKAAHLAVMRNLSQLASIGAHSNVIPSGNCMCGIDGTGRHVPDVSLLPP